MTSEKYPLLFSPLKVGTQEVRNRAFMPPVSTNLADHGYVTDALIDHYTARAAGGVGLIVTADAIVCEKVLAHHNSASWDCAYLWIHFLTRYRSN